MLRLVMGIILIGVGAFATGTLILRTFRMDKSQLRHSVFGPKATWPKYAVVVGVSQGCAGPVGRLSEAHWIWLAASGAVLLIAITYTLFLYGKARCCGSKSAPEGQ